MSQLGGSRQHNRECGREASNPVIEEKPREGIHGKEHADRGERGHDLGSDSPGVGPATREHHNQRLGHRDQGRVQRVDIRAPDDVGPEVSLELLGDPDQLQAILSRQKGLGDDDRVEDHREKDHRNQSTAAGHRDPP